jgi:TRAP-type C4-dicarboxylate transport system substrate-binding protein
MIRKVIWLVILVAIGYVGYRIWHNLNDQERTAVKTKANEVLDKTTEGLKDVADKLTETTKDSIDKHLIKEPLPAEQQPLQPVKTKAATPTHDVKKP